MSSKIKTIKTKPRRVPTLGRTTTGIGVLGGAFNPPHFAHLILAKRAFKIARLKKIIFMPCGIPALKKTDLAKAKDRLAMIKILTKNNSKFEVSDYEIRKGKKGKKSYTLETIRYLKRKHPGTKIYWILGEDSFREMIEGRWKYNGLKMLNEAQFIVADRKTHPFGLKFLSKKFKEKSEKFLRKVIKLNINIPVSATQIREEIRKGSDQSPTPGRTAGRRKKRNKFLPLEIFNYIKKNGLYLL